MGYVPAIISAVVAIVGTGVQMYSSAKQADTANRVAEYNAAIQKQNADVNYQNQQVQIALAQQQANINAAASRAEYQSQINNSITLQNQAQGKEVEAREKARRLRMEQDRLLSAQRGKFARSGVQNEGTPLLVQADTARLTELNIADELYKSNLERTALYQEADNEKFKAGFSLLDESIYKYQSQAASVGERIARRTKEIESSYAGVTLAQGAATASGYRAQGTASLISGIGAVGSAYGDFRHSFPQSPGVKAV